MTRPYKAVFFDLDGTLRITTPSPTAAFIFFARSINIPVNPLAERRIKLWAFNYWGQDELVKQDMARFNFNIDDFWLNYSRLLLEVAEVAHDLPNRAQLVRDWFNTHYLPQVELAPGGHDALSRLKKAGYVLGLISNRSEPLAEAVNELGLDGFFDVMLAAGEIGYWKPNPIIFTHALSRLTDLRASECLYVGDNYYADGCGAAAAGLVPIIYDPEELYEKCSYRRIKHMKELLDVLI
jgi:FMN phosphatase YigB (HAD superfamily)